MPLNYKAKQKQKQSVFSEMRVVLRFLSETLFWVDFQLSVCVCAYDIVEQL